MSYWLGFEYSMLMSLLNVVTVTLPKNLQILSASPSKPSRRSMQSPYRLPNPLPPLPVRKGVRGRRPKSETIALLKAVAEAAAAQNGTVPESTQLAPRPYKKRGPKPGSKVRPHWIVSMLKWWLSASFSIITKSKPSLQWICVYQRKPKVLQSTAQLPTIQVPQESPASLNSVVSTGKD